MRANGTSLRTAGRCLFTAILLFGLVLPEMAIAAEETGNKWGVWLVIGRFVNLALVVGILIWALRKPLASFCANRTQAIREQLVEAQNARVEAETKLAEMESRLARLTDELNSIKDAAEREGQQEYQRLLAAAEADAQKAVERAKLEIGGITRAAQIELKAYVADLSIKMAEEKIHNEITDADRARIFERFVTKLGREQ